MRTANFITAAINLATFLSIPNSFLFLAFNLSKENMFYDQTLETSPQMGYLVNNCQEKSFRLTVPLILRLVSGQ
ncbi:hypothetical protein DBR11_13780 [Pedobacter sp. HMWF019]|nr:hypothetical protein DBR11_13780 [Pedobacter sp. HMWF019]